LWTVPLRICRHFRRRPTPQIAASIAHELQQKNLYVFMSGENGSKRFAEQLIEAGVQVGWAHARAFWPRCQCHGICAGFCYPGRHVFRRHRTGDYRKLLLYNKDRIFAFVMALVR